MKVLVYGGRSYANQIELWSALDLLHVSSTITCIVSGGAAGADTIAVEWAKMHQIKHIVTPAQWDRNGTAAGPIRNRRMLDENRDIVLAVEAPGGNGTAHMRALCIREGLPVLRIPL